VQGLRRLVEQGLGQPLVGVIELAAGENVQPRHVGSLRRAAQQQHFEARGCLAQQHHGGGRTGCFGKGWCGGGLHGAEGVKSRVRGFGGMRRTVEIGGACIPLAGAAYHAFGMAANADRCLACLCMTGASLDYAAASR